MKFWFQRARLRMQTASSLERPASAGSDHPEGDTQRDEPRRLAESPPNQDTILVFPRLSFRPAGVNLAP
jgi:hypothetical protein